MNPERFDENTQLRNNQKPLLLLKCSSQPDPGLSSMRGKINMTSLEGICYCGKADRSNSVLRCDSCKALFHTECLQSGRPSPLDGDIFFNFTCSRCSSSGEEEVERMKLQWLQVVMLTLYNLQLTGMGKFGFFRWKEHICAFIDNHWTTFFGFSRKKTNLWYGSVAGTLSSGCPGYFLSGGEELNEPGWWRLAEMKPPTLKLDPPSRLSKKQKIDKDQPIKVESLRSRRGKTSIQAAMELKAKRSTLTEAKEMRKSRSGNTSRNSESSFSSEDRSMSNECLTPSPQPTTSGHQGQGETDRKFASLSGSASQLKIKTEPLDDSMMELESSSTWCRTEGEDDTSTCSQFSHTSSKTDAYLTEKDLWAVGTVPQFLLKDDEEEENDSDLEIDPGTFSPPRTDSPLPLSQSPTLHDILASFDDSAIKRENIELPDTPIEKSAEPIKVKEEDVRSEVSSSSEDSRGVGEEISTDSIDTTAQRALTKSKTKIESKAEKVPEIKYVAMSHYEERELLKNLNHAAEISSLESDLNRLRRKLIVRQLQREHGQKVFNLDLEVRRSLGQLNTLEMKKHWHPFNTTKLPQSRVSPGETRVLDRFQIPHYKKHVSQPGPSSFLNRLVGTEDNQLQPIISHYTARTLKPFIRRDYESRPLKLRLLEEIRDYPHRKTPTSTKQTSYPIDYCYVRPQHIPSVNVLCGEFFWPGIDLSECLQYPDFSCVVLYRKVVIGFAFMVPDTKYNEAYISFIFCHPEWRQAGIATFMLYHLIQTCMGKDVTLHVSATNSAMFLYQKFGFKPQEFILDFYDKYYPLDRDVCKHAFLLRLQR